MAMGAEVVAQVDVAVVAVVDAGEDVEDAEAKMRNMKQNKIFIALSFTALLLPLTYTHYAYHKLIPFRLNGPQFLEFYLLLCIVGIMLVAIQNYLRHRLAQKIIIGAVMLLGGARLFQGIYNNKPIGYLVLIILAFATIIWLMNNALNEDHSSDE